MRHKKKGRKFTKTREQEKSLFRGLSESLIEKERIVTTEAKAKEMRSLLEKSITRSKEDTLSNRRLLLKTFSNTTIKKLFTELGPRYKSRPGGYTRITKLNASRDDGAKMAVIELIK